MCIRDSLCIGYADSCAVRGEIDPREIVFSVEFAQARIVAVEDISILKLPVYRVFAEADNELKMCIRDRYTPWQVTDGILFLVCS